MSDRTSGRARRWIRNAVVWLAVLLFVAGAWVLAKVHQLPPATIDAALLSDAPYAKPVWVGSIASSEIVEASGFARSHVDVGRIWVVNDGGNPPLLHAMGVDGSHQAAIRAGGVENDDWEDLASVVRDGTAYLLIADTGDNLSRKPTRTLHAFEEPHFEEGHAPAKLPAVWSRPFRFEDGPRDCEGVAIDPTSGEILLLTKRDLPARLYTLPWPSEDAPEPSTPAVARFVTEVFNIPQPTRADGEGMFPLGAMLAQPTSLAISPDGGEAIVLTYGGAYRFARAPGEPWRAAFRRLPGRIRTPPIRGAEAIGFAPGGESVFVGTEGRRSPLYRYDALPR